jgi:hypothetical protein
MASQYSIHRRGRNGSPLSAHNPDQLWRGLFPQRRQAEDTCGELTEDQEQAPESALGARNLRREQIALWLFIVAVAIISFLAAYLVWAKLSLH